MIIKGSFEDFFYILVGLIWVGVSIYKGMQKKKAQQSPDRQVKKKSVLETLMNEFLEAEKPAEPEPIIYEAPLETTEVEEEVEKEVFSYDDIYEKSNYNEVSEVYDENTETKTILNTNLKAPPGKRKRQRFNLRKAVIYSEILNRRYS